MIPQSIIYAVSITILAGIIYSAVKHYRKLPDAPKRKKVAVVYILTLAFSVMLYFGIQASPLPEIVYREELLQYEAETKLADLDSEGWVDKFMQETEEDNYKWTW